MESRHNNIIAFAVDLSLLKNVVKSAMGNSADSVELKLVNRTVQIGAGADQQHPFLVFVVKVKYQLLFQSIPCFGEHLTIFMHMSPLMTTKLSNTARS